MFLYPPSISHSPSLHPPSPSSRPHSSHQSQESASDSSLQTTACGPPCLCAASSAGPRPCPARPSARQNSFDTPSARCEGRPSPAIVSPPHREASTNSIDEAAPGVSPAFWPSPAPPPLRWNPLLPPRIRPYPETAQARQSHRQFAFATT